MLGTGNQAGCPGTRSSGSKAANTDRRAQGNMRRPSGQGPGARLFNGLASQVEPASRAARAHRSSPRPPRTARSAIPAKNRTTERQRPAPSDNPQPPAKFSEQRDRPGEKAFQINRAKRCADLRKRTSLTSGTALGGRCSVNANRVQYTPSTRQDNTPAQDHRDRCRHDHGRHPVGARRWPVKSVPHLGLPAAFPQASDSAGATARA
jgi:hypothetical protein